MQLVFDNLQELKSFIAEFLPSEPASVNHIQSLNKKLELPMPTRRGRKPKDLTLVATVADAKTPRKKGTSLTDRIRKIIDTFILNNKEFTANDVYYLIYKKDKEVNKQSVITSVLKQMNSTYAHIPFEERQGNGPRNVKVYIPG